MNIGWNHEAQQQSNDDFAVIQDPGFAIPIDSETDDYWIELCDSDEVL